MNDNVTTGEIYRRLCDMDERYEKKLDRIEEQVRTTNGRTTVLETVVKDHARELGRINSAVFPRHKAAEEAGEALSIKVSPKLWVALAAAGGLLLPPLVKWLSALLS